MSLPDVSRLLSLPPDTWRAFAGRLQGIGVTSARAEPIVAVGQTVANGFRHPIRVFHLRRMRDAAAYAMRMFLFHDPVTADEARAAMGGFLDRVLDAGLVVGREDGRMVSPFVLGIVDGLYLLSDDLARGGEAVMGLGETTLALCRAGLPAGETGRLLDLGCGAGTAALVLRRRAKSVVATDISPRAVTLARVNAAMNGTTNVEVREGDLFQPVAGETFDLIVSQPPFVAMPEGAAGATFLYGGRRGDEIMLALLGGLRAHLAPGGRAVLVLEWPEIGAERSIAARARAALGADDLDLLVLESQTMGPDENATIYAAAMHPRLDEAFEEEVLRRREHLERLDVRGITLTLTLVERPRDRVGWTSTVKVRQLGNISATGARIDKLMAARPLAEDTERLLAAALRVPEGTVVAQEQTGVGAEQPSTLTARFTPEALIGTSQLEVEMLGLLTFLHEAPDVRAGLVRYAELFELSFDAALARALPSVKGALLDGLLELAS
jgi:methylase of polypeptide subunit release factors